MNVRLPDTLRARLDRVSAASQLKSADLIRMAVEEYCDHIEKTGKITIPFVMNDAPSTDEIPARLPVSYSNPKTPKKTKSKPSSEK